MPEIKPNEIAEFWTYPVVDIPIENLGVCVKCNISSNPRIKQWEPIDAGTNEMLRFPITKQDLLDFVGPGEYHIFLKFNLDDGRHGLYGDGVYVTVGIKEKVAETPPEVVAPTHSLEIEMFGATLAEQKETLAVQKGTIDTLMQAVSKFIDEQKSSDNQFKDQLLMKVIDKMGSNQGDDPLPMKLIDKVGDSQVDRVDAAAIFAKTLDRSALFASKRLDFVAASMKGEAELKRQDSKQKHEIAMMNIQQQLKAGKAARAEVKNDGSPKDDAKKANVAPDSIDVLSKVGAILDNFAQFAEKVKPTLTVIKDIFKSAQGKPLAPEETAEEPAPVKPKIILIKKKKTQIKEPEPAEDESPVWVNKGPTYDPNDPRKPEVISQENY